MPSTYNFSVSQGDSFSQIIIASGDSAALNLNGYTAEGKINVKAGSSSRLYTITGAVISQDTANQGKITVSIPASATSLLPVGIFPYDIDITSGSTVLTAIKGKISVNPGIVLESSNERALIGGYIVNRILVSDSEGLPEVSEVTTTQLEHLVDISDLILLRTKLITRETPSGIPNGELTSFHLNYAPSSETECVYLNGLLQDYGYDNDYTVSGNSLVFNEPPLENDKVRINYLRS